MNQPSAQPEIEQAANDNSPLDIVDEAHRLMEIVGADYVDGLEDEPLLCFQHKFTTTKYNVKTQEITDGFYLMREEVEKAIRNEAPVRRPGSCKPSAPYGQAGLIS